MSPCAYPRLFFFFLYSISRNPYPVCSSGFLKKYFEKAGEFTKVQKKIGRVLQCLYCSGKSINPSLQTVMKARLRVASWESEDLRGQISESRRRDAP